MLFLRNATLVAERGVFEGGLVVEDGVIAAITEPGASVSADRVVDCAGRFVLPGAVDVHVHANDPGNAGREDFTTVTRSAAAGGVTLIVDMPVDTVPPPVDARSYAAKLAVAKKKCVVDFALWGGMVEGNLPELAGLARAGAAGFKAFMVDAAPEYPRLDGGALKRGFAAAAGLGLPVLVHAEDNGICVRGEAECRRLDRNGPEDFCAVHSEAAENVAVDEALALAGEAGCQVHICHASNAGAVERVVNARKRGLRASVETCMHYLVFSRDDMAARPNLLKCAPPLRGPAGREALWERLLAGDIDVVSSDHSPSRPEEKDPALGIWDAWAGINGIQATLPLLYSEGVAKRGLPLPSLVRLASANPARLAGLFPRKGDIRVGGDADLVVLDPAGGWLWNGGNWLTKHGNSPYLGLSGRGAVVATYVRGIEVFAEGRVMVEPGFGQYLPHPTRRREKDDS